jgi:hypothetical protein
LISSIAAEFCPPAVSAARLVAATARKKRYLRVFREWHGSCYATRAGASVSSSDFSFPSPPRGSFYFWFWLFAYSFLG